MMRNYGKSLLAGIMAMSGSLTAQNFPVTKEAKEEISTNLKNDSLKIVKGGFQAGADGELFRLAFYAEFLVPKGFKDGKICSAIPGQHHMMLFPYVTKDTIIFLQKEKIKTKKRTMNNIKVYYHLKTDPGKEVVRDRNYKPQNDHNQISRKDSTIHVLDEAEQEESFYKDAQGNVYTQNDIVIDNYEDGGTIEVEDYYYGDQEVKDDLNTVYIVSNQLPVLSETGKKEIANCKAYLNQNPDKKISILAYNASKEGGDIGSDGLLERGMRRANDRRGTEYYVDALALRNALKTHADKLVKVIKKEMGPTYKNQIEYVNAYDKYQEFSYPKGDDGKVYPAGSGFVVVYPKMEVKVCNCDDYGEDWMRSQQKLAEIKKTQDEAEAREQKEAEEKARLETEAKEKKEAELAAKEKARLEAESKIKEEARKQTEEAKKQIEKSTMVASPKKNLNEEISDIQQQILDLICLSEKFGHRAILTPGNKITTSNTTYQGGVDYIYWDKKGRMASKKSISRHRKHILTAIREGELPPAHVFQPNDLKVSEAEIPEVDKKILIKARDHLQEQLGLYHYRAPDQRDYWITLDPKNINFLGTPVDCKTFQDQQLRLGAWYHGIKVGAESTLMFPEKMNTFEKIFCDSVSDNIYFQKFFYKSDKDASSKHLIPVLKTEHCMTPLRESQKPKVTPIKEVKDTARVNVSQEDMEAQNRKLTQHIFDLICLWGKGDFSREGKWDVGKSMRVVIDHGGAQLAIYFHKKQILVAVRGTGTSQAHYQITSMGPAPTLEKTREYLEKLVAAYHYGDKEHEGYYVTGHASENIIFLGKPLTCDEFHDHYFENFNTGLQYPGFQWQRRFNLPARPRQENSCDNITKNCYFQRFDDTERSSVVPAYCTVVKAPDCFVASEPVKKAEPVIDIQKAQKEAELAAKEKARLEAEEAKKEVEAAKKAKEAEEKAEAKEKKEIETKTKEKAEAKNVTDQDAERVRELMLRFLKVLECEGTDDTGEAREARLRLKDAIGNDVKCVLEYDPDISGIANNRKDHLQDANKIVTFKRKGKEYTLSMTFDPEHKAKLYDSRDGSKFEFETSDHEFAFWFGEKFGKNVYKMGTYDGETGKQDINDATALLEEILKLNTCAENTQPKKVAPKQEQIEASSAKPVTKEEIKAKQEQIKKTEKEMNEIFEYGQKVIFVDNRSTFNRNHVEEGLDKLYALLQKNPSLTIKVTGYFGGSHPTLPLERAEKVRDYLVDKGIDEERIHVAGGKEKIAKSIRIEIVE